MDNPESPDGENIPQGHSGAGGTCSVEIHQRLGVARISQGLWVQMFPILPWERLPMAL